VPSRYALRKIRNERWQAASDLTRELKWIADGGSQAGVSPQAVTAKGNRSLGRRELLLSVGALLSVAAIAGIAVWNLKPSLPQAVTRMAINLPLGQQLAGMDSGPSVALSPDGSDLAYVAIQVAPNVFFYA